MSIGKKQKILPPTDLVELSRSGCCCFRPETRGPGALEALRHHVCERVVAARKLSSSRGLIEREPLLRRRRKKQPTRLTRAARSAGRVPRHVRRSATLHMRRSTGSRRFGRPLTGRWMMCIGVPRQQKKRPTSRAHAFGITPPPPLPPPPPATPVRRQSPCRSVGSIRTGNRAPARRASSAGGVRGPVIQQNRTERGARRQRHSQRPPLTRGGAFCGSHVR